MRNIDARFFVIHGWMMSKLGLCGCDRDVYSIIYGFSQDGESDYHGSIGYLSDLTQYSKRSCGNSLKFLTDSKLVIKYWEPNAKSATYKINFNIINNFNNEDNSGNEDTSSLPENTSGEQEDTSGITENTSYNNIDIKNNNKIINNTDSLLENNKYIKEKSLQETVDEVIDFMNTTCHTSFKKTTNGTKRKIKSLIKQGFSLQDMKNVILCKYEQWGKKPIKFSNGQMSDAYLRPDTLFSDKFESYLSEYQKNTPKQRSNENNIDINNIEIIDEY